MRESENETEASTTFYLYDREDRIADYDQSGNLLIAYTHGPGIDEPVAMTLNNSTYFYIPDIQGSIRAIISADNGSLAAYYTCDVWGNLVSYGGSIAEKNDYLYTGREYDWQTGIYYYRYRYYNPEIGRFIQSSWEHTKEMNMYVYVGNDPANNEDPTGHPGYVPPYIPDHSGGTSPHFSALCDMGCISDYFSLMYSTLYSFCCKQFPGKDCDKLWKKELNEMDKAIDYCRAHGVSWLGNFIPGESRPWSSPKPRPPIWKPKIRGLWQVVIEW